MDDAYSIKHKLDLDNQFYVDGRDFTVFTFPKPEVKGWSTLIGKSKGSVTVEAEYLFPGEEYPTRFTLARTEFNDYGQQAGIKKHYSVLLKEWNKDNRGNWLRVIRAAVEKVASYHEKNITESRRKFEVATDNLDWLAEQEV